VDGDYVGRTDAPEEASLLHEAHLYALVVREIRVQKLDSNK
jgi:hypothetical protein